MAQEKSLAISAASAIRAQPVLMTPERAQELLAANHGNRALVQRRVDFFVDQIRSGRWHTTGDAISVSITGRLITGQHRLNAIVKSGIAVVVLLATGLSNESRLVSDRGKPWTIADITGLDKKLVADVDLILKTLRGTKFTPAAQDTQDVSDWWRPAFETVQAAGENGRRVNLNNGPVRIAVGLRWATEPAAGRNYVLSQFGAMTGNRVSDMSTAGASLWKRLTEKGVGSNSVERMDAIGWVFHHLDPKRRDVSPLIRSQSEVNSEVGQWLRLMADAFAAGPAKDKHPYLWAEKPRVERALAGIAAEKRAKFQAKQAAQSAAAG